MSVTDLVAPLIGLAALIASFPTISKIEEEKSKRKYIIVIFIGIIAMGVNIWQNWDNSENDEKVRDTVIDNNNKIKVLQDTLKTTRDSLLKIGLSIDEKTGKILVLDSQILKKSFSIFNDNTTNIIYKENSDVNDKLNEFFPDLAHPEVLKREIALKYIMENFPTVLSNKQIDYIAQYVPRSNNPASLYMLLSEQPSSEYLAKMMKEVILKRMPMEYYSWKYLLSKMHIGLPYIESAIKSNALYSLDSYKQILGFTLKSNNIKISSALLNSKEIVSVILANRNTNFQMDCDVIVDMIKSNRDYNIYKDAYFFEAIKK